MPGRARALREPAGRGLQRLVPGDLLELAGAARADALQRRAQPRRRRMRHDAGRALAADHALVDRVVAVAVDVADPAVLQMDPDAAAAGAHVAGGGLDLVGRGLGQRNVRFLTCHRAVLPPASLTLPSASAGYNAHHSASACAMRRAAAKAVSERADFRTKSGVGGARAGSNR